MKLIKCENEHFYDSEKFLSCPHCANQVAQTNVEDIWGKHQKQIITAIPQSNTVQNYPKIAHGKTVGWLVCIEGNMLGESFVLREGDNFIGRAANMDIALIYEPTVSRESHAIITYDSSNNSFTLYSLEHQEQTFCNNKKLKSKKILKNRDTITLGNCTFLFIAFCNASFRWSTETKQQEDTP